MGLPFVCLTWETPQVKTTSYGTSWIGSRVDLGAGGTAYYTCGLAGVRIRKVVEKAPNITEERLYLGNLEIFRRRRSGAVTLEREKLHIGVEQQRIVSCELRLSNHLQSSVLELDKDAEILSMEEYSPYGSTKYRACSSSLELPKRCRFTGKERDEETGLSYHGSRYYARWLARWVSADPIGTAHGANLYCYVNGNPIRFNDSSGKSGDDPFSPDLQDSEVDHLSFSFPENKVIMSNSIHVRQVTCGRVLADNPRKKGQTATQRKDQLNKAYNHELQYGNSKEAIAYSKAIAETGGGYILGKGLQLSSTEETAASIKNEPVEIRQGCSFSKLEPKYTNKALRGTASVKALAGVARVIGGVAISLDKGNTGEPAVAAGAFRLASKIPIVNTILTGISAGMKRDDPHVVESGVAAGMAVTKATGLNVAGWFAASAVGAGHALFKTAVTDTIEGIQGGYGVIAKHGE
ncbi:MAG: hypothetical protein Q9184_003740 [Pyrenodesmia sp. 2 TL-2023]